MEVRSVRAGELDEVISVWHAARKATHTAIGIETERGLTLDDSRRIFREVVAPRCQLWVAERGGEILGFLAIRGSSSPTSRSASAKILLAGLRGGIVAFAAHALVDFPARIPAIAVLLAVQIGLTAAGSSLSGPVRLLREKRGPYSEGPPPGG